MEGKDVEEIRKVEYELPYSFKHRLRDGKGEDHSIEDHAWTNFSVKVKVFAKDGSLSTDKLFIKVRK